MKKKKNKPAQANQGTIVLDQQKKSGVEVRSDLPLQEHSALQRKLSRDRKPVKSKKNNEPAAKTQWQVSFLWLVAGIITFWSFGYTQMMGADLWWHIASGRYIVDHFGLPSTDPFSYTATNTLWIVDAWLSDVILYLWSKAFGLYSLIIWKWLVVALTFTLLMRLLQRLYRSPTAAYLATFLGAAVAAPFMDMRPQLHSLLCFVILLSLTLKRPQPTWLVIPLFLIWSNLHAGFTLGLVMLPFLLYPYFHKPQTRKRTILIGIASIGACLVNPNGYHLFTQPILYALKTDSPFLSIAEWLPPFKPGGIVSPLYPYAIGLIAVCTAVFVILAVSKKHPFPWQPVLICGISLVMSLKSRRFVSTFAISQTLIVACALVSTRPLWPRVASKRPKLVLPMIAVLLGIVLIFPYPQQLYAFHFMTSEYLFPIDTIDFINVNQLSGKIFSLYDWGGYLHFRTNGRMKVFIDGRASAVFNEQTYSDYLKVLRRSPGWIDIVENSGADFFLWPVYKPEQTEELVNSGKWMSIYHDIDSILLVKKTVSLPMPKKETLPSPSKTLTLCSIQYSNRLYSEAESCTEKVLQAIPYHVLALELLIRIQGEQCHLDDAQSTLKTLGAVYPRQKNMKPFQDWLANLRTSCVN
jgi:hypothetical protein